MTEKKKNVYDTSAFLVEKLADENKARKEERVGEKVMKKER